ncbi:MAG: hypothetical protein GXY83_33640 [Rhodopirellula sp.]|nr:hypothetical protein [Rhodopirellula sp.]
MAEQRRGNRIILEAALRVPLLRSLLSPDKCFGLRVSLPLLAALVAQLREGGRMVIPVGQRYRQNLSVLKQGEGKDGGRNRTADVLRPNDGPGGRRAAGIARRGQPSHRQR